MTVQEINKFVERKNTEYQVLTGQLSLKQSDILNSKKTYDDLTTARWILSEASRVTQMQFKSFVESLVTLAIQTVFPEEGYKFLVEFGLKANRSEINLLVQQGDKDPYYPEEEQGGGLLDIISFALRIVLYELEKPISRNVLLLDEPFRFCGALTPLAIQMMKEISTRLNIQMIIVTHDSRLSDLADRVWQVNRIKGGESIINLVGEQIKEEKIKLKRRK
jgi:DNA repair exonuclease SbcCD ATPase subunit